ncbi:MAG: Sua5/YciO/YrdC/YwlC family protein [Pseudomonadales bacterium]|nr:Sua5/YciO/YrdC/YwlC family protein [Pseudomonadales bacterium]
MKEQQWRYRMIATRLREEQIIAYPTEGVWGLGCVPESEQAVGRILNLKRRPWQKGLILVASELSQLLPYLQSLDSSQRVQITSERSDPVTWLVPKSDAVPLWISGEHDKVAVRLSQHPVVQGICSALKQPIVSTSANPAGKPAALSRLKVHQYFADRIDYIVPGDLGGAAGASQIIDLVSGDVLREAGTV